MVTDRGGYFVFPFPQMEKPWRFKSRRYFLQCVLGVLDHGVRYCDEIVKSGPALHSQVG